MCLLANRQFIMCVCLTGGYSIMYCTVSYIYLTERGQGLAVAYKSDFTPLRRHGVTAVYLSPAVSVHNM